MDLDVTAERVLAHRPDEVAAYAMDWRHDHEWTQGIKTARLTRPSDAATGPDDFGPGAEVTRTAKFLGKRIDYVLKVIAHDPPALLEMRSVAGPFPMEVTYRFDRDARGTRASIRVRGDASGSYRLARPLMAAIVRRNLRKDLRDLERMLSTRT